MAMGRLGKALNRLCEAHSALTPGRAGARTTKSHADHRRHRFEPLEERCMLSATSYEPTHYYETSASDDLSSATSGDPLDIAIEYLTANADTYGLDEADVASNLVVTSQYTDSDTGVTHIYLQETYNALDVVNTNFAINIASDGSVLSAGGETVGGLASLEQTTSLTLPKVSATKALQYAATALGIEETDTTQQISSTGSGLMQELTFEDSDLSTDSISTTLHYVATTDGMRLAWGAEVSPSSDHLYAMSIDALTGEILIQEDLVDAYAATPTISIDDAWVVEGDDAVFTVSLSFASDTNVTVDYVTASGSATQGGDFLAVDDTLTFAPGEITKSITVTTVDDTAAESDQTFRVNLSNATNATIADAQATGTILDNDTTGATATYRVLQMPTASPEDPDVTQDPWVSTTIWGARTDDDTNLPTVTDATDPSSEIASPYGWHDTDGLDDGADTTTTTGNNVITTPLATGRTVTTNDPSFTFSSTMNLAAAQTAYTSASVTNAFYWVNLLHDIHYVYGFDEAAGNYQNINYTGLGAGGDAVTVSVQDITDVNNNTVYNQAYFVPSADGTAGLMVLGVFSYTSPRRDAALDTEVIIHEYGHGVSTRLVGGSANTLALRSTQSAGMGEGWSDFWSLMLTQNSSDSQSDSYPVGTYLKGESSSGTGIRRYAYSYDMTVDPLTYSNYNDASESHELGEVWCSTLWDLNWLMIDKYGFSPDIGEGYTSANSSGNQLMLQLVTDSLKLLPANPTFLDGRDALLLADQIRTGGANQQEIWSAFSRRGMGLYAYDGGSADADTVTEDFTCPPDDPYVTTVYPAADVASLEFIDFTFSEAMNTNSFSVSSDILSFTSPSGVDLKALLASQITYTWLDSTTLRVSFPAQDASGVHTFTLGPDILSADNGNPVDQDFSGTGGQMPADSVTVSVSVAPDSFGYQAVETAYESISLLADTSAVALTMQHVEPTVAAADDGYATIPLGSNTFRFYGSEYTGSNQLYVYANGLITLGGLDDDLLLYYYYRDENLTEYWYYKGATYLNDDLREWPEYPAIAAYWDDLFMNTAAGASSRISYKFEENRLIIEWARMSTYGYQPRAGSAVPGETVTFQLVLELNTGANVGNVICNYADLGAAANSDGVSATVGIKDYGIAGTHRILYTQNHASTPNVTTGSAVMFVNGGSIAGTVFSDANSDGTQQATEAGIAGWGVYLDLNNTGSYEASGDRLATTDSSGNYIFKYLPWGTYTVRQITTLGWAATAPAATSYSVSLLSGLDVTGKVFGDHYTNTAPTIADQAFPITGSFLYENSAAGTVVGTIQATDADTPAQTLTYTVISGNESGAFAVNSSTGVVTVADSSKLDYETTPTFNLIVRVSDSVSPALSDSANIAIRLTNVNDAPVVTGESYFSPSNSLLSVAAPGLLQNDKDPEGGLLVVSLVSGPSHGTLPLFSSDGAFSYQPAKDYTGTDQFVYKVTDVGGLSVQATVTINVGAAITVILPDEVWESQGTYSGAGTITIPYALTRALVVTLDTSDANGSELSVPSSVTLPAGQTSVTFNVTALDDPDQSGTAEDGSQTITVNASASDFYTGSDTVTVRDNDVSYFYMATISTPQVVGESIRVDVEARDAGGLLIEIYGGAGFFTASTSTGATIKGVTWETYVPAGEDPPEQAFEDGKGVFLVTIPSLASGVQLVVSDTQSASGHKGYSNRFDVTHGSVRSFEIETVASPQWVSSATDPNAIVVSVTAEDSNGFTVTSYTTDTEVTAWKARDALASTIVITEIGDGTPDYLEIQNVTDSDVDTSGWAVLINDPTNSDATAVMAERWLLSDITSARSVDYRSDDPADASHYFGANIPWGASTGKGWVMIVDDEFQIRDFVAWGYDAYTIEALLVDVGATSVRVYDPTHPDAAEWFGDTVAYGASSTLTLQRMANRDGNGAADFAWLASSCEATNPALVLPFLAPVREVGMTTNTVSGFSGGTYGGGVYVEETATQVFLRFNDRAGHIGESNAFAVETEPVAVLTSTPGMYDPSTSTFYLRNSNSSGFASSVFGYGPAPSEWIPISGDWNGDGYDTVGLYDPATSTFYLANSTNGSADVIFGFGAPAAGWTPVAGDWDGDGRDSVGLYDAYGSVFYLTDTNATSIANRIVAYGPTKSGWTPIAGNWDGLGGDGVGLYSPSDSVFYLKNETTAGTADLTFGFGEANWTPIAGDWDGDGVETIGLLDPNTAVFYQRNANSSGFANAAFGYGSATGGWIPVMGDWNGIATLMAAAESTAVDTVSLARLQADQLQPMVAAALDQWSGLGLSTALLDQLAQVEFAVADLPGDVLGMVQGQTIYLDVNAAGRGWFVDTTPEANEEFVLSGTSESTAVDPAAVDRVDLLTVVAHELGHVAGLEHLTGEDALMSATLARGVRRTAGLAERDALFADGFGQS